MAPILVGFSAANQWDRTLDQRHEIVFTNTLQH